MSAASVPAAQLEGARLPLSATLLDCLAWIEAHPLAESPPAEPPPRAIKRARRATGGLKEFAATGNDPDLKGAEVCD